jgi:hypothetical protein
MLKKITKNSFVHIKNMSADNAQQKGDSMIFVIKTDDEIAGLDVTAALARAGIPHTIISKTNKAATTRLQPTAFGVCVFFIASLLGSFLGQSLYRFLGGN